MSKSKETQGPLTAEEFYRQKVNENYPGYENTGLSLVKITAEITKDKILHLNLKKGDKLCMLSIPLVGSDVIDLNDELVMTYFVNGERILSDQIKIEKVINVFPD